MKNGIVYTPRYWADWVVDTYGIADKWINGAVVLDPGCGTGALSEAVIRLAVEKGFKPSGRDLARLLGNHCFLLPPFPRFNRRLSIGPQTTLGGPNFRLQARQKRVL